MQSEEVLERIDNQNIDGWEEDSVKAALSVRNIKNTLMSCSYINICITVQINARPHSMHTLMHSLTSVRIWAGIYTLNTAST
jgi:hypothetical protein